MFKIAAFLFGQRSGKKARSKKEKATKIGIHVWFAMFYKFVNEEKVEVVREHFQTLSLDFFFY